MRAKLLALRFNEVREERNYSFRMVADELHCSFSSLARFSREGLVGIHLKRKIELWLDPEKDIPPCVCPRCVIRPPKVCNNCMNLEEKIRKIFHDELSKPIVQSYIRMISSSTVSETGLYSVCIPEFVDQTFIR